MRNFSLILFFALIAQAASASTITPVVYAYDTENGESGYRSYLDESYNGGGDPTDPGSTLSGGTGDLTDGVVATDHYYVTSKPYVGWLRYADQMDDPVSITFSFDMEYSFDSVTIFYDDPDKNHTGPLGKVEVGGVDVFELDDPAANVPTSATLDLQGFVADELVLDLYGSSFWFFVSEITFSGSVAPLTSPAGLASAPIPASSLLLLGALGGLMVVRRRSVNSRS